VALASAGAITLLNHIEYAVFAGVYFLAEGPLLLGLIRWSCLWGAPGARRADRSGSMG